LLTSIFHINQEEAYQAIVEHDKRRARMLKERLEHHERRLEEHTSGRMLLQDDEHERTLRQINVFSNHLDRLLSETYLEKMEKVHDARKSVYNMHRNDYLDYSKTGLN
jgi:oligoribonuclease NrnB/cAMP/cGMP phosphodiesterase (DHH superfamily)